MTYIPGGVNGTKSNTNNSTTMISGSSTLSNAIDNSTLFILLTDVSEIVPGGGTLKINNEYIIYSGFTGQTLNVTERGAFHSVASSHNAGDVIFGVFIGQGELNNQPDVMTYSKIDQSGTLYYDFSPDDLFWGAFPVNGFDIIANIPEFHVAVKGPRHFRIRFENKSGAITTYVSINTYYGVFRQGNLPLNQTITNDTDTSIVRAVQVGEQPSGSYSNVKGDGSAFRTTTNLAGTQINNVSGYDSTYTGNIIVSDATGFIGSGYLYIGTEYIAYTYVNGTTLNISQRGSFGSTASSIADGSIVGQVYDTNILTLDGYTEVATKILCSNTGQMKFTWYADSTGNFQIRTLNPSYTNVNTYDYLSAPNFGPYVRYIFANTQPTATTIFYFETEFYTKSISAQILTIETNILSGMTANVMRSINVGKDPQNKYVNQRQNGLLLTVGGVSNLPNYSSSILNTDGYTQYQVDLYCDVSGTIITNWYDDSNGTILLLSSSVLYNASLELQSFSAPTIGQYVKFEFNEATNETATAFYLQVKNFTNSISGQVLGVISDVDQTMMANLGRNIIMGQDKASNFKNVPLDSEGHIIVNIHEPMSAFGQLKMSEETNALQILFPYNVSSLKTNFFNMVANVSTTTAQSGSGLTVDYTTNGSGVLTNLFPNNRGTNYALNDVITVSGGNATGTIRSINSDGSVLAIEVTNAGTGYINPLSTAVSLDNMLQLTNEANQERKVRLTTKKMLKYRPGTGCVSRFSVILNTATLGLNQYVGLGGENNGFFIGSQDTEYGIFIRKKGIDTFIPKTSFNVDLLNGNGGLNNPTKINIDFTKGNVFSIQYQWLGFGVITFRVEDGETGRFELFHVIKYPNKNTTPSIFFPTVPFSWEIYNKTNSAAFSLQSASAMAALEGKLTFEGVNFAVSATSNGSTTYLVSLRNKKYFYNQLNTIQCFIRNFSFSNDTTNQSAKIIVLLNPTITNTNEGDWTDINTGNSSTEYNESSAAIVSGGIIIGEYILPKTGTLNTVIDFGEILLNPTDVLTVVSETLTSNLGVSINWVEVE